MRYELRSIGIWSFVKVAFFVNLVAGFVSGLLYAMFFGAIMAAMSQMPQFGGAFQEMQGVGIGAMLILFPIMGAFGAAFFGTLFGLIFVAIYNLTARVVGGLELNFQLARIEGPVVPGPQHPDPQSPQQPPSPAAGQSRDMRAEKADMSEPVVGADPTVSTMTSPPVSEPRPTEPIPPEAPSRPANQEGGRKSDESTDRSSRDRGSDQSDDTSAEPPEDRPRV